MEHVAVGVRWGIPGQLTQVDPGEGCIGPGCIERFHGL